MEFLNFGELLANGFRSSFDRFKQELKQELEQAIMALSTEVQDKISLVLQNQDTNSQATKDILTGISQEVSQFGDKLAQFNQTIQEKDNLIAELLEKDQSNQEDKAAILQTLDAINAKQQEQFAELQQASESIKAIVPDAPPVEPPVEEPTPEEPPV